MTPDGARTPLVPGTQATTLRDHLGNVVFNAVRVQLVIGRGDLGDRDPDEVGRLLWMEHALGLRWFAGLDLSLQFLLDVFAR